MNRLTFLLVLSLVTLISSCSDPAPRPSGELKLIGNWSPEGLSRRDVWVWTPPGYDTTMRYPVLYMHDGQMLFDSSNTWNGQEWRVDETMERLIAEEVIRPAIVVGIAHGDEYRRTDYFPEEAFDMLPEELRDSLLLIEFMGKARGNEYAGFIVREIKPYILEHYSISEQPSDHFVMGSSMGGLASLYCATRFPEHFGGAACLSTHWPGTLDVPDERIPEAILEYTAGNMPNPYALRIYFDHGTEGLDSLYAPYQATMDSIMIASGYVEPYGVSKVFDGAGHSEQYWAERLEVPLTFLLGK